MERGDYDFPYKCERGRRFGVQSGNTLRACPSWIKNHNEPDTIQYDSLSKEVSLDKHKHREKLEKELEAQSWWQRMYHVYGYDPDDYERGTRIVEESNNWPAKPLLVINGNLVDRSILGPPPDVVEPHPHKNTSKTVSRSSRKKHQQRKKALEQYLSNQPKDGQQIWRVQRNKPNWKMIHERDYYVKKWDKVDSKIRRIKLRNEVQKLHKE